MKKRNYKKRKPKPSTARFLEKTQRQENGCLFWTGCRTKLGYGRFNVCDPARVGLAYRWWWEQANGLVPEGLELDHLCRNPPCVEPTHLEAVTHKTNLLRGEGVSAKHARKTHCDFGHLYDESNTYRRKNGSRECRVCQKRRNDKKEKRLRTKKVWCHLGHLFDERNTYWRKDGWRVCRTCQRKRGKEYDARQKEKPSLVR